MTEMSEMIEVEGGHEWYEFTEGSHQRWEDGERVRYIAGDPVLLSKAEAESHKARIRRIGPPSQVTSDAAVEAKEVEGVSASASVETVTVMADDEDDEDDEVASVVVAVDNEDDDPAESEVDWSFTHSEPWKSVVSLVESLDDPEEVRGVMEAEKSRSVSRPSVLRAARERLNELL